MREQLKTIRTREEHLDELRRRRRNLISKADSAEKKLQKMGPEHKNLVQQTDVLHRLRAEIGSLDVEIMSQEAAIGDFKRTATRSWMGLKFGGLLECCEKGVVRLTSLCFPSDSLLIVAQIVGEYGKLVVAVSHPPSHRSMLIPFALVGNPRRRNSTWSPPQPILCSFSN